MRVEREVGGIVVEGIAVEGMGSSSE